jgi:hypothetical protein
LLDARGSPIYKYISPITRYHWDFEKENPNPKVGMKVSGGLTPVKEKTN